MEGPLHPTPFAIFCANLFRLSFAAIGLFFAITLTSANAHAQDTDIVARIGGDEFVVLALETSGESQEAILRRLETGLEASNARESRYQVSLSVGVAKFDPKHPVSLGDLVSIADRMMYAEKRNRRRRYATQS